MLFSLFDKLDKTSASGCFLLYVLVISYKYSYKTQVFKMFFGLVDKRCLA